MIFNDYGDLTSSLRNAVLTLGQEARGIPPGVPPSGTVPSSLTGLPMLPIVAGGGLGLMLLGLKGALLGAGAGFLAGNYLKSKGIL